MRKKPVQQRSRQMVECIIEASAKVVGEEGLAALTTNRVAEVAGVSNGSLYQYFQNRDDLLEALTERASQDVMALFDLVVESSVEGIRKPNPRIYEIACERLGVHPERAVFLDDLGINLKPARALGMRTIKVEAEDRAIRDLAALTGIAAP